MNLRFFFYSVLYCFSSFLFCGYTAEQINVDISGYGSVPYALWQHPLQSGWDYNHYLNQAAIDKMKTIIPEGSVVIDIGAHVGDTSVLFSIATGKNGKVIAFEPSQYAFKILKMNADLHQNIIPFNFAITETDGIFNFLFHGSDQFNGQFVNEIQKGSTFVRGLNLEKFIFNNFPEYFDRIKFIKIDCEGYDLNIIKSIENFLLTYRPVLSVEVFPGLTSEQKADYFITLERLGYKMYCDPFGSFFDAQHLELYDELNLNRFIEIIGADIFCFPVEK